jgi:hypothetical protein
MKLFQCQHCGQPLYFENTHCESCGYALGYLPALETISALEQDGDAWHALAEPNGRYRYCENHRYEVCNWLVPAGGDAYCPACRHNRTIPDLSQAQNLAHWRKMEIAKHRMFYSLLRLRLPLVTRAEDPEGLAFDFLSDQESPAPVLTGHENGLITINLAEADDAERERRRSQMGEPYRTLLGHFRHEIAHYYWDRLVAGSPGIETFRAIFGDERRDYDEALGAHYANGAPSDWAQHFITPYATSHPWEDWAETWAHYFHMVDTLETASAFGLHIRPKLSNGADALTADIDFDPYVADLDRLVTNWLPLTFAVNSINRSMGLSDLYPFVLAPSVIVKLDFIHETIHTAQNRQQASGHGGALRAVAAGLKRKIGAPTHS